MDSTMNGSLIMVVNIYKTIHWFHAKNLVQNIHKTIIHANLIVWHVTKTNKTCSFCFPLFLCMTTCRPQQVHTSDPQISLPNLCTAVNGQLGNLISWCTGFVCSRFCKWREIILAGLSLLWVIWVVTRLKVQAVSSGQVYPVSLQADWPGSRAKRPHRLEYLLADPAAYLLKIIHILKYCRALAQWH